MANHSSIHTSESLPFSAMLRLPPQGQKSNYTLFQNGSVSRPSQYENSSNLLGDAVNNCATSGTSLNGIDEINSEYWDMESFVSSQPIGLGRSKVNNGAYEEEWSSGPQQQDTMENYGSTGGSQQKLDSFSEAFYGRSISRFTNGVEQVDYNVHPKNCLAPNPAIHYLSFPLVLSPPPTPLPPPSLSPPKRVAHLPAAQSVNQGQSQSPFESNLQCFPLPSTSPTLTDNFPTNHWLSNSSDANGSRDETQNLLQDPSPSLVCPGGIGIHLRQLSVTERDTDCTLDTAPCSPLVQQPPPPSLPKPEPEPVPVTSEHHMTLSQMMLSSQPFGSPLCHLQTQTEGRNIYKNTKPISGFRRTYLFSSSQSTPSESYTGVPFHSLLQSGVVGKGLDHTPYHYTPLPMLKPTRNGTGLFCNLLPPRNKELWSEESWPNAPTRIMNIGPEFQAELPELLESYQLNVWPEEPLQEDLLWKPWAELEESEVLQDRVENLLDLSASTALPGGAANLELALHSLSFCQGNILAALEIMFFSNSAPTRDYHYTGRDVWLISEQKLFHKAFAMYNKDFFLIHKMVKTKQVSQCVEFYYHSKRLQEKQRKQKKKEKQEQQQQTDSETLTYANQVMIASKIMMNSMNVDRIIHSPPLASSFPCKQCGKMFHKIKSRNAHMKIHRQQQEDWRERIHANNHFSLTHALQNQNLTLSHPPSQLVTQSHPNQMLTQSLIQNLVQSQAQLAFIQSSKNQSACFTTAINSMSSTQNPQTAPKATALPLYTGHQQTWDAIHGSLESSMYYD